jgi:hypothetical protein
MRDRGQIAFGCSQKQIESEWSTVNPETRPNQFASDLLLPTKRFVPLAKGQLPVLAPCLERTAYCRQAGSQIKYNVRGSLCAVGVPFLREIVGG